MSHLQEAGNVAAQEGGLPPLEVRGVDVSSLVEVEGLGAAFYTDQERTDLMSFMAAQGVNLVRLRLWVDPRDEAGDGYLGGGNDLSTDLELARRAVECGMDVMIDLHYSDFWTDPKKQQPPKAWSGYSLDEMTSVVRRYTREVLGAFVEVGIQPRRVQVGNEITNGMLWPVGALPRHDNRLRVRPGATRQEEGEAFDALAQLLRAGTKVVREALPGARVSIHLDYGGDTALYQQWLDPMSARGLDIDEVGISYYPYWHGTLDDLSATMDHIVRRYGYDVIVLETAYGASVRNDGPATIFSEELADHGGFAPTPAGQYQYLTELRRRVAAVAGGKGRGFVYWEPAWLAVPGTSWASEAGMRYGSDIAPGGPSWANQALFDSHGHALPAWQAFQQS
ncbi:MAG: glycosyl hydrolase 53 family protein [Actinomyces urogenitalis]|uniref:glycoside hydrolase family 53 protein n=1 Tax=Actinomyces urogenitalis TaxID=103621 RepID=UPI002A80B0CB|nr:glycosyl hydrolase 53 family protein [Actinomyces urogenitalis]MDY3679376.1 glycosyl hydrolase 53 family protein [Actinomyces urogenitalis]